MMSLSIAKGLPRDAVVQVLRRRDHNPFRVAYDLLHDQKLSQLRLAGTHACAGDAAPHGMRPHTVPVPHPRRATVRAPERGAAASGLLPQLGGSHGAGTHARPGPRACNDRGRRQPPRPLGHHRRASGPAPEAALVPGHPEQEGPGGGYDRGVPRPDIAPLCARRKVPHLRPSCAPLTAGAARRSGRRRRRTASGVAGFRPASGRPSSTRGCALACPPEGRGPPSSPG